MRKSLASPEKVFIQFAVRMVAKSISESTANPALDFAAKTAASPAPDVVVNVGANTSSGT